MKLKNETYDKLKLIALVATPIITFLVALCTIWKVPHCDQVTATLAAIDALVGALVVKLSVDYNKENTTEVFNQDLLKDMLGFDEDLHELGEKESEVQ